jgi:hypothetical protein
MVKGERIMPVPGGEITSTETWDAAPEEVVEVVEAVEEVLPDEELDQA